jgi:hypothetical protein
MFSILSYNIKGLTKKCYQDLLVYRCVEEKIDIICLQNLTEKNMENIIQSFADKGYFCIEFKNDYVSFCLIFTKLKIEKAYNTVFEKTKQRRTVTRICLNIEGKEVWIYTSQLENIVQNNSFKLDQLKEIFSCSKSEKRVVAALDTNFFTENEKDFSLLGDFWFDAFKEAGDSENEFNIDSENNHKRVSEEIILERTNRILYKGLKCTRFKLFFKDSPITEQFACLAIFQLY